MIVNSACFRARQPADPQGPTAPAARHEKNHRPQQALSARALADLDRWIAVHLHLARAA